MEPWWGSLVQGLRTRTLAVVSIELGVPEDMLVAALVAGDPGGPAQAAPWWPEVVRQRRVTPLRALARRFGCEPRRIRRALAREGLRTGGAELGGGGVPALARLRERLGREPDAGLAREAGVSVEAVQGERARLGIPPFRPGAPVRLTAEEEAWILGPQRERRVRMRPDADSLQIVRRPSRSAALESPATGTSPPAASSAERAGRGGSGSLVEAATPMGVGGRVGIASGWAGVADETRGAANTPPADAAGGGSSPAGMGFPTAGTGARLGRGFFSGRDPDEIDRLLQPTRARDGRQRIVRAEIPRLPAAPSVPERTPRARPPSERATWRPAPANAVPTGTANPEAAPSAGRLPSVPSAPSRPPEGARPVAPPRLAVAVPLPPVVSVRARGLPPTVESQPTRPPHRIGAVEPPLRGVRTEPPAGLRAPRQLPLALPRAGVDAAPELVASAPTGPSTFTWLVHVPGDECPMVIQAADVCGAAQVASTRLPRELWAQVSIELAGAERRDRA